MHAGTHDTKACTKDESSFATTRVWDNEANDKNQESRPGRWRF